MLNILIELPYLPSVEYFGLLVQSNGFYLEACENYQKQTHRHRCSINGANNIQMLIVPVKKKTGKIPIRQAEIDYTKPWRHHHIRSIQSSYGKAPYYQYYAEELFEIIEKKITFLFDLNLQLLTKCLELMKIDKNIKFTDEFNYQAKAGLIDLRGVFNAGKQSSELLRIEHYPYYQVFGRNFVKNLSVIDLLFCEGPNALEILHRYKITPNDILR